MDMEPRKGVKVITIEFTVSCTCGARLVPVIPGLQIILPRVSIFSILLS